MSLYDDYINSVAKVYYVDFLGRVGVPGHAFVNVRVSIDATVSIVLATFGLYPDNGKKMAAIKSLFTPVSGKITFTFDDIAWDTKYTIMPTNEQVVAVIQKMNEWKSDTPKYSLFANNGLNCNGLVGQLAALLNLKIPDTAGKSLPWNFIKELKDAQGL